MNPKFPQDEEHRHPAPPILERASYNRWLGPEPDPRDLLIT